VILRTLRKVSGLPVIGRRLGDRHGFVGESVAVVVGAGELGSATATLLAGAGFMVVAVDRTPNALDELPEGIRREVGDTTDQAVAKPLIDRIAGEAGPLRCW